MPINILLVEDETRTITGLRDVLEVKGYSVTATMNYESGLEAGVTKKNIWHLAIIDLELGDGPNTDEYSGLKLIDELRKKHDCKFPIIVYSGNTYTPDLVAQAIIAGENKTSSILRSIDKPDQLPQGEIPHINLLMEAHRKLLDGVADVILIYTPPEEVTRGPITLYVFDKEVRVRDKSVGLTTTQYDYLYHLMISRMPAVQVNYLIREILHIDIEEIEDEQYKKRLKDRVHAHIKNIRRELQRAGLQKAGNSLWPILYVDKGENGSYQLPWGTER